MENGLSLIEYISRYHHDKEDQLNNILFPIGFQDFLNFTTIVQTPSKLTLPQSNGTLSYLDLVDYIVSYLHLNKSDDVLLNGYSTPSSQSHLGTRVVNPEISFLVNQLKGVYWNQLYNSIGFDAYCSILLNTKCYTKQNGNYVQIWGKRITFTHQAERLCLLKRNMLYKYRRGTYVNHHLLSDSISILSSIFPHINTKNLPKSFRKLKKLLDKVIINHQTCDYDHIFSNLVPYSEPLQQSILKNATELPRVVRFCLTIVGKVFPLETWGTKENKVQILHCFAGYLKSRAFEKFYLNEAISSIKITNINWLGRTQTITSKQDNENRIFVFSTFIQWVFTYFLQKIVRSFWYVTDSVASDQISLLYFPHYTWNRIQEEWLGDYISKYLVKVNLPIQTNKVDIITKYNFGRLRLVPKLNDFRLICVPSKLAIDVPKTLDENQKRRFNYEYLYYKNHIIRPARQLLNFKLNEVKDFKRTFYSRCHSSRDIAIGIMNFKKELMVKNHELPIIFMVKFDMKHCFDRLNQNKILECAEKLFADDDEDKLYFIRQFWETSASKKAMGKLKSLIADQQTLTDYDLVKPESFNSLYPKVIIDRSKTLKISKKRLIDIVKSQVFDSICMGVQENSLYRRKHGVFQGFALLSTLCDLVYDTMVLENFEFLEQSNSRLFRLVDDFLVFSTDFQKCEQVILILGSCTLQKYGAFVNAEKTDLVMEASRKSFLKFVGLNINTSTLEINRTYPKSAFISATKQKSFKSTYSYLNWCYTTQMDNFLINLDLVSLSVALSNITFILSSILDAFYLSCKHLKRKGHEFNEIHFQTFLLELLLLSLTKFQDINESSEHYDQIVYEFKQCMADVLGDKDMFIKSIQWIAKLEL